MVDSKWSLTIIRLTGVSVTLVALFVGVGASPAAAQSAATSAVPLSGPVGTVVTLRGNAGPDCSSNSFPTLNFGQGATGPTEFIEVPVASDGAWSATFVIPSFVGGLATRGGYGADVTPGLWQFQGPVCQGQVGPADTVQFDVTGTFSAQPASRFVGMAATPDGKGYWLAQSGGGVFSYGTAAFHGSLRLGPGGLGVTPAAPIAGIAATPDGGGYWLVGQDGGVFAFGNAGFYGSLPNMGTKPFGAVVGITATPTGHGYWLLGADGGVFPFGDAGFDGAPRSTGLANAVTTLLATPGGNGYMALPADGDAPLTDGAATLPSGRQPGPMALDALISGGAITSDGDGVWEVGTDGGVFAFGTAGFYGSLPGMGVKPAAPIVGMAKAPGDGGYWLIGADGGVFSFGDAGFYGSAA
jgi:hypothetical protein